MSRHLHMVSKTSYEQAETSVQIQAQRWGGGMCVLLFSSASDRSHSSPETRVPLFPSSLSFPPVSVLFLSRFIKPFERHELYLQVEIPSTLAVIFWRQFTAICPSRGLIPRYLHLFFPCCLTASPKIISTTLWSNGGTRYICLYFLQNRLNVQSRVKPHLRCCKQFY